MKLTVDLIQQLREKTNAPILDCKKALIESKGDLDRAGQILREKGIAQANKRSDRETREGIVVSYIHPGGKLGVLVQMSCESDFVARTDDFRGLAHDLAMQVAATNPHYLDPKDIPAETIEREREREREQIEGDKPEEVIERILEGKLRKYYEEVCLLEQPFIKDDGVTVRDLITSQIAKLGENIKVRRYARFQLEGE